MKAIKNTTSNIKLKSIQSLKHEVKYIFTSAKKHHTSHAQIIDNIKSRIYEQSKYETLPNYMQSEIHGYIHANFDNMYDVLTWAHWYDGKFVGSKLNYDSNFDQSLVKSYHVYIGSQDKY